MDAGMLLVDCVVARLGHQELPLVPYACHLDSIFHFVNALFSLQTADGRLSLFEMCIMSSFFFNECWNASGWLCGTCFWTQRASTGYQSQQYFELPMVPYACHLGSRNYYLKIFIWECLNTATNDSFKWQHPSMYDCSAHKQIHSHIEDLESIFIGQLSYVWKPMLDLWVQ